MKPSPHQENQGVLATSILGKYRLFDMADSEFPLSDNKDSAFCLTLLNQVVKEGMASNFWTVSSLDFLSEENPEGNCLGFCRTVDIAGIQTDLALFLRKSEPFSLKEDGSLAENTPLSTSIEVFLFAYLSEQEIPLFQQGWFAVDDWAPSTVLSKLSESIVQKFTF